MAGSATSASKASATKRVRKAATTATATPALAEPPTSELACFSDGGGQFPNFRYFRYWWRGEGQRPSIVPLIDKKLRPGDDPRFGIAAKIDLLLPDDAPGDYLDLAHLLERYGARHQPWQQSALVQLNFYLEDGQSAFALFERVRSFCRVQFVSAGCPVILTLHVPGYAGHENPAHCHAQILPRTLGPMGFGSWHHDLACDTGNRSIYAAWQGSLALDGVPLTRLPE